MTDLSTANLKHLLAEATPGPWEARRDYSETYHLFDAEDEYLGIMHDQDAHLTALAPPLAQEVLRMREELIAWANDEAQAHNSLVEQAPEAGGAGIITTHKTIYNRILEILGDHDD